ncbi:MAG: hypothetical protein K8S25_05365 [Alphaproteobacteria bacterium]|nr:hypothetical protein [Alphaproteobacteria bacterium]
MASVRVWMLVAVLGVVASVGATAAGRPVKNDNAKALRDLKQAEVLYGKADHQALEPLTDRLLTYNIIKAPPVYEVYFFKSYVALRKGRLKAADTYLSQFKCMLNVEAGQTTCKALKVTEPKGLCRKTMCAERYRALYETVSAPTRKKIQKYRTLVRGLEAQLGHGVPASGVAN